MKNCVDTKYKEDHDYLECIEKFSRKDMLLLALHQEWVKRRYTKPTFYRTLTYSIAGIFMASLAVAIKLMDKDDMAAAFIATGSSVMLLFTMITTIRYQKLDENSEVDKLNEIRKAIEKLQK